MNESERDKTTFNASQLKLIRVDEIQRGIIMCRHTMDLQQWLYWLQDFDNELETVKKSKETMDVHNEIVQLTETINIQRLKINRLPNKSKLIDVQTIDKLDYVYKRLLTIYHDSGMEMQLEKDSRHAFG